MIEIGRLCVKTAGRDAGCKCIVVDILDNKYVLIDGETRRRKCNIIHLEPLATVIPIKKNASHEEVKKEFEKLGLKVRETKPKEKKERRIKHRKGKKKEQVQEEEKEKKEKEKREEKKVKKKSKKKQEKG